MTIETARRASLEFVCVFGQDALGPIANTDTKLLIYGLFQKGRVLAQDAVEKGDIKVSIALLKGPGALVGHHPIVPASVSRRRDRWAAFGSLSALPAPSGCPEQLHRPRAPLGAHVQAPVPAPSSAATEEAPTAMSE